MNALKRGGNGTDLEGKGANPAVPWREKKKGHRSRVYHPRKRGGGGRQKLHPLQPRGINDLKGLEKKQTKVIPQRMAFIYFKHMVEGKISRADDRRGGSRVLAKKQKRGEAVRQPGRKKRTLKDQTSS